MIPQLTILELLRLKHKKGHIDNNYFELFRISHGHITCLCENSFKNDPGMSKVCLLLLTDLLNKDVASSEGLEHWLRKNYKNKRQTLMIGWNADLQHLFV